MLGGVFAFVVLTGVLLGAFNLVLDEYAQGAIRTALEEGARAGASWEGSSLECQAVAAKALASLLRGPFGAQVRVTCTLAPGEVLARASGRLPSLLPVVPAVGLQLTAIADATPGGN